MAGRKTTRPILTVRLAAEGVLARNTAAFKSGSSRTHGLSTEHYKVVDRLAIARQLCAAVLPRFVLRIEEILVQ